MEQSTIRLGKTAGVGMMRLELTPKQRLCLALDVPTIEECKELVAELKDYVGVWKVNSTFTKYGKELVDYIKDQGCDVFIDMKFHDIPNTVANHGKVIAGLGASIMTIHSCGGKAMMEACVTSVKEEANKLGIPAPKILAITVLTSIDDDMLNNDLNVKATCEEQVVHLAKLAKSAGVDGVVASPKEVPAIREAVGDDFIVLTPGIRPTWAAKDDQKRALTPKEAIQNGSDYLVMGRPILKAEDRVDAAKKVLEEME